MKKTMLWVSLALGAFFLISCVLLQIPYLVLKNTQSMPRGKFPTIELTEADDRKSIEVTDGTYINITLPVDHSSGYAWELKDDGSAKVVEPYEHPEYFSDDPLARKGVSGGHVTHHFQACGMGKTTLLLELRRDDQVAQTFTVTIDSN